jgi:DNA mismatch repair ATPase MutS
MWTCSVRARLQGKRLLQQWFLRPVVQLEVLADRHDTIDAR